jgi:hypothetical protein
MFVWAEAELLAVVAPVLVVVVADLEDKPLYHQATQDMAPEEVLLADRAVTQDHQVGQVAAEVAAEPLC